MRRSQLLQYREKKDNNVDHNMEIITIIIGGIVEKGLNVAYWKAQIWKLSQVKATRELKPPIGSTMTFYVEDMRPL